MSQGWGLGGALFRFIWRPAGVQPGPLLPEILSSNGLTLGAPSLLGQEAAGVLHTCALPQPAFTYLLQCPREISGCRCPGAFQTPIPLPFLVAFSRAPLPLQGPFVALTGFFVVWSFLGVPSTGQHADVLSAAQRHCEVGAVPLCHAAVATPTTLPFTCRASSPKQELLSLPPPPPPR